jgi:DNA-binding NtrC family response regulator
MIIYQGTAGYQPAKHPTQALASASATDLQAHEAWSRQGLCAQGTVLVIDDEEPVRETLVEVLSFYDYHVITAASVAEAEDAKDRLGADGMHLVISDIHLTPGSQVRAGYALAQRWCAEYPRLPIILISGDSSNQDLPEVREGALRFLLKPFRMENFLDAVRDAFGR